MKLADRVWGVLFWITLFLALLYMVWGVLSILNQPYTSFPWYTPCVFTLMLFGPALLVEAGAILFLHKKRDT